MYGVILMLEMIICDDNLGSAEILRDMLAASTEDKVSIQCAESCQQVDHLITDKTDVVFMDIILNDANGIDYAAELKKRYPLLKIVFITAFMEYCEKIFLAQPVGFLVKPFKSGSVREVLTLINNSMKSQEELITLQRSKNSAVQIDAEQIFYIESLNRRLYFYGKDNQLMQEIKLRPGEVEDQLPDCFLRCHYSFFVNMKNVSRIKRFFFTLKDGKEIPISQSRFNRARDEYFRYLGGLL